MNVPSGEKEVKSSDEANVSPEEMLQVVVAGERAHEFPACGEILILGEGPPAAGRLFWRFCRRGCDRVLRAAADVGGQALREAPLTFPSLRIVVLAGEQGRELVTALGRRPDFAQTPFPMATFSVLAAAHKGLAPLPQR